MNRREFLTNMGVVGATLALPTAAMATHLPAKNEPIENIFVDFYSEANKMHFIRLNNSLRYSNYDSATVTLQYVDRVETYRIINKHIRVHNTLTGIRTSNEPIIVRPISYKYSHQPLKNKQNMSVLSVRYIGDNCPWLWKNCRLQKSKI